MGLDEANERGIKAFIIFFDRYMIGLEHINTLLNLLNP